MLFLSKSLLRLGGAEYHNIFHCTNAWDISVSISVPPKMVFLASPWRIQKSTRDFSTLVDISKQTASITEDFSLVPEDIHVLLAIAHDLP